jgi:hypothetical protein
MKYLKTTFTLATYLIALSACGSSPEKATLAAETIAAVEQADPVKPVDPIDIFKDLFFHRSGSCGSNDLQFTFASSARIGDIRDEGTDRESILWWGADVAIFEDGSFQGRVGYSLNNTSRGDWKVIKGNWSLVNDVLELPGLGRVSRSSSAPEDREIQFAAGFGPVLSEQVFSFFAIQSDSTPFEFARGCR